MPTSISPSSQTGKRTAIGQAGIYEILLLFFDGINKSIEKKDRQTALRSELYVFNQKACFTSGSNKYTA
jgi:hypothetical protein